MAESEFGSGANPGVGVPVSPAAAATWWARLLEISAHADFAAPARLVDGYADAAARVLQAAGVSVSLRAGGARRPVGVSGPAAAVAEGVEFGLGDGPSLRTSPSAPLLCVSAQELAQQWPLVWDGWCRYGDYRSLLSAPLPGWQRVAGRMDVYYVSPTCEQPRLQSAARWVAQLVADQLRHDAVDDGEVGYVAGLLPGPAWLSGPAALAREQVWVAVGMLQVQASVLGADALALLRGYAYAHGQLLDELADALVSGRLPLEAVTA